MDQHAETSTREEYYGSEEWHCREVVVDSYDCQTAILLHVQNDATRKDALSGARTSILIPLCPRYQASTSRMVQHPIYI
jgi:hypothetical protein